MDTKYPDFWACDEQRTLGYDLKVRGSNPLPATNKPGRAASFTEVAFSCPRVQQRLELAAEFDRVAVAHGLRTTIPSPV
jgi:hypothetical protein